LVLVSELGISRSRLFMRSRDQDQDLSHLVSRRRPRPEPPGLETKTKTLATRSRDQDQDLRFQVSSELEFETLGLEITSLHLSHRLLNRTNNFPDAPTSEHFLLALTIYCCLQTVSLLCNKRSTSMTESFSIVAIFPRYLFAPN